MKIAIIDYKLGNLYSVQKACQYLGFQANVTSSHEEIMTSDYAILPGVGAFHAAMESLDELNLRDTIHQFIASGKPFLGICLGLQLLFDESEEFGMTKGLGIIKGKVVKFDKNKSGNPLLVPQIQWNKIRKPENKSWENTPLEHLQDGEFVYFVHSYFVVPEDKNDIICTTDYEGVEYCSAIQKGNIFACQFHPEKSGLKGIEIIKNWIKK